MLGELVCSECGEKIEGGEMIRALGTEVTREDGEVAFGGGSGVAYAHRDCHGTIPKAASEPGNCDSCNREFDDGEQIVNVEVGEIEVNEDETEFQGRPVAMFHETCWHGPLPE